MLKLSAQIDLAAPFPLYLIGHMRKAVRATAAHLPKKQLKHILPSVHSVSPSHPVSAHVGIQVVSKAKIRKLNDRYRKKPRPTDVLSFPLWESAFPGPNPLLGDVVICWEIAKEQRKRFHTTCPGEIQRLTVHGLLHLLGYDHENDAKEAKRMFSLENKILRQLTL